MPMLNSDHGCPAADDRRMRTASAVAETGQAPRAVSFEIEF